MVILYQVCYNKRNMIKRRNVPSRNFQKNMAKKRKNKMPYVIAAAMSVLAAASVGLFFYSGGFHPQPQQAPETTVTQPVTEPVSSDGAIRLRTPAEYPLMPTQLEGVFVSANPFGQFSFYEYADGGFTACTDAKELDVTVTCSHQQLPAKVYYLQRGDDVTGYGLFLTTLYDDDVRLYDYAFMHLVTMPESYGSGDAMLLVDFDEDDFAKADKTYTEVLSVNLSNGKTSRLTSDNGRTVDRMGRLRTDWAQMNDALLQLGADKWYLSGRNYQLDSTKADILYNADTSNTKPKWISSGLNENVLFTENGTLYGIKETDGGFDAYSLTVDGKETKLASYAGSVDDYLFADGYMLEKNTLALTRLSTGESKDIGSVTGNVKGSPAYFGVSPDGAKFALLCDGEDTQSAVLLDLTTNACQHVRQKGLFANSCTQITWLTADSFATVAETETGYETLVWAF